ncbi:MAG: hypothetical protein IKR04_07050 [Clostridia bacterium]|nr:hypothetical protein [Clostridia bacterium]
MPIISFWNPTGVGQTGTTATMVSVANSIAIRNPSYKILLTQTHFSSLKMESAYFNMDRMRSKGNLDDITDIGVDALERLLRSNKITPESIKTYAKTKGDTIEVLYGSFKGDKDSFRRVLETIPFMLDYAAQCYDMVFVDLTSGLDVKEVDDILKKSDVIVVTLNQDKEILNKMEERFSTLKVLQEKPILPVFARYDQYLAYNSRNILRNYNFKFDKREVYTIPYNSLYFDALNDGRALDFFIEHYSADPATTREGWMISECAKISDKLLKLLGSKVSDK